MPDRSIRDYALYRLEKAADELDTAQIDFNAGKYNAAANRAYYAIFHAIRSVLALDEKEFSKHSGTLGYFSKEYLATETVNRRFSAVIKKASAVRNAGDYDDFYEVEREEAAELIEKAAEFHQELVGYVSLRLDGQTQLDSPNADQDEDFGNPTLTL